MIDFRIRYCEASARWQAQTATGWTEPMTQTKLGQWLHAQITEVESVPMAEPRAPRVKPAAPPEVYSAIKNGKVVKVVKRTPQPKAIVAAIEALTLEELGL